MTSIPPTTRRALLAGAAGAGIGATGATVLRLPFSQPPPASRPAEPGATDWINAVTLYGADPSGSRDSTTAIQRAIGAVSETGGVVYLPVGVYQVSKPLSVAANGFSLVGAGYGATTIQLTASFAGHAVIDISNASGVSISNIRITGPGSSYSSSPAADGITIANSPNCTVRDCYMTHLNGYAVTVQSSIWSCVANVHASQCAYGARIRSNSQAGYNAGAAIDSCIFEQIAEGDALLVEDAHDVLVSNLEVWNLNLGSSSTGSSIRIKGDSAAVAMSNIDVGGLTGTTPQGQPTVLIEAGPNGTPSGISITGGIIQCGTPAGLLITAGKQITVSGIQFFKNAHYGLKVVGTADVLVTGCYFSANGYTSADGNSDVLISANAGTARIESCKFLTSQGTGSEQVASAINGNGCTYVEHCYFGWAAGTTTPPFGGTGGGHPKLARNNVGYNPVGPVKAPAIPPSGSSLTNPFGQDCLVCVTGGAVTSVDIGGVSTGLKNGAFQLPWGQQMTLNYTSAPTWTWFCD